MRYAVRACILRNNFDGYLDQLIEACKASDIDEIMMCEDNIFISAISQPLEAHREMAELMKAAVAKCKAAGLRCSFYLKSMIGHFTCKTYVLPYTKFVGFNGEESVNECCLMDDGFARYAATLMGYYAECGFEKMMLDDDVRSVNHCNGQHGCVCDLHLAATASEYGKPLTRQQLIDAFSQFDEESLKIKKAHRKVNFAGQLRFVQAIEQAVHQVDPNIQLGQMISGVEADQFQGRDVFKFLQTLAGEKHRPFLRPPGGYYSETLGDALLWGAASGLKYRALLGNSADFVSEVEVYSPRNIFTKTRKMLDLQMQVHALTGFDYLSLNVLDHFGTPLAESTEYLSLLKERKAYYDKLNSLTADKENWGIGMLLPDNYVESLKSKRFGLQGTNSYPFLLQKLGLPVCYHKTEVNFLTAELLGCYSDAQVTELLRGGVILDEEAVAEACRRGFGELIGIQKTEKLQIACYEQLTGDPMNGSYAGDRYPVYTANVHANENGYNLTPLAGARVLTELADAKLSVFGAGTVYFENALGGKVLCLGTVFSANNWLHKCRRYQLHSAVKAMFGDRLLFDVTDAITVAPIWYRGEQADLLAMYNFSIDDQEFCLELNDEKKQLSVPNMTIQILNLPH